MKGTNKLALALALALASSSALALGLGPIRVKSALNEPLRAEIPVVSATADELRGLKVDLASDKAFERVGLDRADFGVALKFAVVKKPNGKTVIEVTTEKPVSNPALDFLIAVNWPKGKLLREYAVLLDPPNMAPAVAAAPSQPQARPAPAAAANPGTSQTRQPAAAAPVATTSPLPATSTRAPTQAASSQRIVVKKGDTLSALAKTHAVAGVGIDRMMEALRRGNPDAFFQQNINALKSGAVLRIPDRDALAAIDQATARAAVHAQNQQWAASRARAPMRVTRTGGRPTSSSNAAPGARDKAHLALVPPRQGGDSASSRAGVRGGTGEAAIASLKQKLNNAQSALVSEKQHSEDLQGRIKDLQGIKDKNSHLLSLKNTEIAELQRKLAAAHAQAEAAAAQADAARAAAALVTAPPSAASAALASVAPAAAGSVAKAPAPAATGAAAASSAAAVAGSASSALAMAATALAPAAAAASSSTAAPMPTTATEGELASAKPTIVPAAATPNAGHGQPWYMQNWLKWLIGLIIVALIAFGLMKSRRKPKALDAVADDGRDDADIGAVAATDDDEEADLIEELLQHPDDLATHLELASLYYAQRDAQKFEAAAQAMHARVDDPQVEEWQQVEAMGEELCPDAPLFAGLGHFGEHDDEAGEFDHDGAFAGAADEHHESATDDDTESEDSERTVARGEDGYSFDFNLSPTAAGAHAEPAGDELEGAGAAPADDASAQTSSADAYADDDEQPEDVGFGIASEPSSHADSDAADADITNTAIGDDDDLGDHEFSSDPVDTKLDLARAYQDMGDGEGARAMLDEVLQEGSEAQKDTARKLLEELD